jgi:hypothetical protein
VYKKDQGKLQRKQKTTLWLSTKTASPPYLGSSNLHTERTKANSKKKGLLSPCSKIPYFFLLSVLCSHPALTVSPLYFVGSPSNPFHTQVELLWDSKTMQDKIINVNYSNNILWACKLRQLPFSNNHDDPLVLILVLSLLLYCNVPQ